ncbi:MAG: DUF4382 domain-containing protein [Luteibaculaceae bacterium]
MKKIPFFLILLFMGVAAISCNKEEENVVESAGLSYPLSIRLTDAPGPYDSVLVDIQGVEVFGSPGGPVIMQNVNTGVYDLLLLVNGIDTLIATDTLTLSRINQVRLILGSNNSVVVDGVSRPLQTPSAMQSGLKINVNRNLEPFIQQSILLDFDANQSIVRTGNGNYILRPVIRAILEPTSGSIKGSILPAGTNAVIQAITSANDTISTGANEEGHFMILGLGAGTYTVNVIPEEPFNPESVENVEVVIGQITQLEPIELE